MARVKKSSVPKSTGGRKPTKRPAVPVAGWTFLTNHAHVLVCLTADPHALLREVASRVGVTERAVQGIVADLEAAGVLSHRKEGRRNVYTINGNCPLRHPVEAHRSVADLLGLLT